MDKPKRRSRKGRLSMVSVAALSCMSLWWLAGRGKWVLERRHANINIASSVVSGRATVVVSGWIMHSGLCVETISETRDRDRIILRVKLAPPSANSPCRSSFLRRVAVPVNVHEVWLGTPPSAVFIGSVFLGRWLIPASIHDWFGGRGGEVIWRSTNVSASGRST